MRISIIVAAAQNRTIGRDGDLPWKLSSDLKRFKKLTMGHHIIMGRKTFESIGRLLPGRTTVVITRQEAYTVPDGGLVAHSLDEAITLAKDDDEAFIIGGAQLYDAAFPRADRLYLTTVEAEVEGDTHFPEWQADNWTVISDEQFPADERNDFSTRYRVLERLAMTDCQY